MTDEHQQIGIGPGQAVWWGIRFIGWIVGAYFGFWLILFAGACVIAGIATVIETVHGPFPVDDSCIYMRGAYKYNGHLDHGQCYGPPNNRPINPEAGYR